LVDAPNPMTLSTMECTTGPLGTGIATIGGMTMGGLGQAATFTRLGYRLVGRRHLRRLRRRPPDGVWLRGPAVPGEPGSHVLGEGRFGAAPSMVTSWLSWTADWPDSNVVTVEAPSL